jgi:hypothetical protein
MSTVLRNFVKALEKHAFLVTADNRYQPPKIIVNGVDIGDLPTKVLVLWKDVVEKLGDKFDYPGGLQYWRNKCLKNGIDLPEKYRQGGKGAAHGRFKVMSGDQIEDWIKARLKSEGLVEEAQQVIEVQKAAVADVQMSLEALLKGSLENEDKKKLQKAEKDVQAAVAAVAAMEQAVEQHVDAEVPVISFEKQFQALLDQALNDLSRKQVLAQARAVLAQFEAGMKPAKMAGISELFGKMWDRLSGLFTEVRNWADDLAHSAKSLEKLFSDAK